MRYNVYMKIGLALYFLSFFLFFTGLFLVDGFFTPGFIVLWTGTALIVIGIAKRDRLFR